MFEALLASIIVASLSLLGAFVFGRKGFLIDNHRYVLPIAVGIFLGVIFFKLIPETIAASPEFGPMAIAFGFLGFYLLSYFLDTFHHHHHNSSDGCIGKGAQKLLIGDAIHNIADGIVIATSFMINPALGVVTTIGIGLHEIPQEIAEFGVLLQSGYTKKKAAILNLLSASSIILGVLLVYALSDKLSEWIFILTGIAAGNLLYIATADLIPELKESHQDHFWQTFLSTVAGLVFIVTVFSLTKSFPS